LNNKALSEKSERAFLPCKKRIRKLSAYAMGRCSLKRKSPEEKILGAFLGIVSSSKYF
jgi:hypothetical protein